MENPVGLSVVVSLAGAYALLVSVLYLFGYWGVFKLNIFEYIGLGDIVTHAIFPFFIPLVSIVIGGTLLHWFGLAPHPPPVWSDTRFNRFWARSSEPIFVILIAVVGWFGAEPYKWFPIAFFISGLLAPLDDIVI